MATEAKVRSLEALETLRAAMIVFISRARRALDQVGEEVSRTRLWVQSDQQTFWAEQVRKRTRAMELAQAELFSAKLSTLKDTTVMQEMQLRKARRLVEEATEKLRSVKVWSRDFDTHFDPLLKKLETTRRHLDEVMPRGVNHLASLQKILEAYTESAPPAAAPAPAPDAAAGA